MKLRILIPAALMALIASSASAYDNDNRDYCREFTKTIYIGGRAQQGYGLSCLQPDGSWKIAEHARVRDDDRRWDDDDDDDRPRHMTHINHYRPAPIWYPPHGYHHKQKHCRRDHGRHHGWRNHHGHHSPHYGWYGGYRPASSISFSYESSNHGGRYNQHYY